MSIDKREALTWRWRRIAYYSALTALGAAIGLYFGPNVILFGKLTWLTPADFVGDVQRVCLPAAVAVKEFERDHGRLPVNLEETVPQYLSEVDGRVRLEDGELRCYSQYNHVITYSFAHEREGWRVQGAFTRGVIPLPIVVVPATMPSTRAVR